MNEELIYDLVVELKKRKGIFLLYFYYLRRLVKKYYRETKKYTKNQLSSKIRALIFNLYLKCLPKDISSKIRDLSVSINEDEHNIIAEANSEQSGWNIGFTGAKRLELTEKGYKVTDFIPREYNNGFILEEDASKEAKDFYKKESFNLSVLSKKMDEYMDLVTYSEPKPEIPRESFELLTDYLDLTRVPEELRNQKEKKKVSQI